jgi:hypothetical protein
MSEPCVSLLFPGLAELSHSGAWQRLPRLGGAATRVFTASPETFDYAHHASLGVHGGLLHAFWSNGRNGEDLPGQVQCWAVRDEHGVWSAPRILTQAPSNSALYPEMTTAINGGTARGSGHLTSFYSEYKGRPGDGVGGEGKWSLPLATGVRTYDVERGIWIHRGIVLEDFLLNEGPRRTALGRWLMTGEDHAGRTRVAYSDASNPADPAWHVVGVTRGEGSHFKNEPTWYQRPDSTLVLLLRDDGGSRCLWLSESRNNGLSWSIPRPTNLPDATAKCCAGQLSHGAYYIVSNPDPAGGRIPLAIALSDDGFMFSRLAILRDEPTAPRLPGRFKGPGYQYPNAIERSGQLHIIYSLNKEDIEVLSVSLEELAGLPSLVMWPTPRR